MNGLTQLAVNIPDSEFQKILSFSKKKGISIDEIIIEAIHYWQKESEIEYKIKLYEDGYKRLPENLKEIEAFEKISFSEFNKDEW